MLDSFKYKKKKPLLSAVIDCIMLVQLTKIVEGRSSKNKKVDINIFRWVMLSMKIWTVDGLTVRHCLKPITPY